MLFDLSEATWNLTFCLKWLFMSEPWITEFQTTLGSLVFSEFFRRNQQKNKSNLSTPISISCEDGPSGCGQAGPQQEAVCIPIFLPSLFM